MSDSEPRLPVVGEFVRTVGTLVRIEVVTPPPPPPETDYIFEKIEARCELRLRDGTELKKLQTLNDFYGLETSVETAIEEMEAYAQKHNIGPDSDIEVVVVKVTSQCRAQPIYDQKNFYDKEFMDFNALPLGSKRGVAEPVEEVVWSSRGTKEETNES